MCILFIAINQHKDFPLIIAANRDEFYRRPTHTSAFWPDVPHMLAGKDLQAGGTWMGVTRQGKLSALTNIRAPETVNPQARTRGELVANFLSRDITAAEYLQQIQMTRTQYNGYNLLFGDWHSLFVYNNHLNEVSKLEQGVYGLSNANLNSDWPKVNSGMRVLADYCRDDHDFEHEHLFDLLKDSTRADDANLPQTGVPLELERALSSIYIRLPEYGTRSSTVLTVDKHQHLLWLERTYDENGHNLNQKNVSFSLK